MSPPEFSRSNQTMARISISAGLPVVLLFLLSLCFQQEPAQKPLAHAGTLLFFDTNGDQRLDPFEAQNAVMLAEEHFQKPAGSGVSAGEWREFITQTGDDKPDYTTEARWLRALLVMEEDEPTSFQVGDDGWAEMNGVIGPWSMPQFLRLLHENRHLKGIRMVEVPGSMDDDTLVRLGRLMHQSGLAAHVAADGMIASGGVDFFVSATKRSFDESAKIGVHSWDGDGVEGANLPKDNPAHQMYLDFYREIQVPEGFYWFTLQAAPAAGIHWMTPEELKLWLL